MGNTVPSPAVVQPEAVSTPEVDEVQAAALYRESLRERARAIQREAFFAAVDVFTARIAHDLSADEALAVKADANAFARKAARTVYIAAGYKACSADGCANLANPSYALCLPCAQAGRSAEAFAKYSALIG